MAAPIKISGSTLAFLPLLGVVSPLAQAAEIPFPSLSLLPNQPEPGGKFGQATGIASPLAPLTAGMSVEASEPQFLAQVLPSVGATNTQISVDGAGQQFDIGGGIQAGENLFHRFDQFDLEANQVANFLTNPGLEAIFSQIGGEASSIDGLLKVSGSSADLFLINPKGILFGPNARLDLSGSFTATTADRLGFGEHWIDLLDEGFTVQTAVAGSLDALEFSLGATGGAIANQGQLTVAEGQSLGLLGNAVVNTGSLTAPGGEVTVLSASGGQRVSLGGGLLNLDLAGTQAGSSQEHSLPTVVAQSVAEATGLNLNTDGSVSLQAGTSIVAGYVDVSSAEDVGGQVRILGDEVEVTRSVVDASGAAGGEIYVGGDYQGHGDMLRAVSARLDEASVLRADGLATTSDIRPDGGEVVVWSDGTAEFAGTATAQSLAPGGDGGLVETSGKQQLNIASTANVNTTSVDGVTGQWLIDPVDLTIVNGGGIGTIVGGVNDPGSSTIDAATVEAGLNGNNVSLQADNSITIDAPIDASANASGGDLNLDSPNLNLNERIILSSGSELFGTATMVNVGANGSIQNGVDAVASGGTVNLAAATYREGSEIDIDKQLRLQGQGAANTTISGDANGDDNATGITADNHRILSLTSNADGTAISGITFRDGVASSNGAGLTNDADNVTIEDSVFSNNKVLSSSLDGGAIYTNGQRLGIDNTRFENNYAEGDGGAIDLQSGSVDITNSNFSDNVANAGHGGAIDLDPTNAELTITDSSFERNSSATEGGALFTEGDVNITNSSFIDNTAVQSGGAISQAGNTSSTLTILDSTFTTNRATSTALNQGDGGAVHVDADGPTIIRRTNFASNSATNDGGAISIVGSSDVLLDDVDILNNNALGDDGGGIYLSNDASLQLQNSRLVGNIAVGHGGGLSLRANSQAQVSDTIFQANQSQLNGGAIANTSSNSNSLSIVRSTFSTNQVLSGSSASGDGGAIFIDGDGSTTISGTTFSDNTTTFDGGAIAAAGTASLSIDSSTLERNQALGDNGGGIFLIGDVTLNLSNSLLDGNTTVQRGGGLFQFQNAKSTILNTRFENNQAVTDGGAIASQSSASSQLTISGSTFDSNSAQQNGGGLYLDVPAGGQLSLNQTSFVNNSGFSGGGLYKTNSADLTISSNVFEANEATERGGGIAADASSGTITLTDSNILQNIAALFGGGIQLTDSNLSLQDVRILTNQSIFGGALELNGNSTIQANDSLFQGNNSLLAGGAIHLDSTSVATIFNSQFLNNQADSTGGAIFAEGSLTLDSSLLQANTAGTGGGGIALSGTGGTVSISSTTVNNNTSLAGPGGGLRHGGGQTTTIVGSTFSSNVASDAWNGGALDLFPIVGGTTILIENSTLSSNRGGNFGGAISQAGSGQTTLNNVTVANNTASAGGGLANAFGGNLTLQNTIVAGNIAASNPDITGPIISLGNNLVQNRATSTGYVSSDLPDGTDPLLLSLANNAGLTETHAVRANSLAVDGANATATAVDQRGLATVNLRDIGAYELDNNLTFAVTGSGQTQTVNQAFANPVGVTITDSLGAGVAGLDIDVAAPMTGASASLGALQTDNSGFASTTATANTIAGSYTVNLGIASNSSIGTVVLSNSPDAPDQITLLNGNNQSTIVNTTFANPLQLAVTDQFANPIPSQAVGVSLPGNGASASATNGTDLNAVLLVTDSAGQATINLTANTIAGNYAVGLTSGSLSNNAALTNLPDVPEQLLVDSGNNQSTVVNTAFANPLLVAVTDQFGNVVPGAIVNLSFPGTGASVRDSSTESAVSLTTDGLGQATTSFVANTVAGSYGIGLATGSVSSSISLTNLPDAPDQVNLLGGSDQVAQVNTAFADELRVQVLDQFANVIPGVTVTFTAPMTGSSSAANADLSAVMVTTDGSGQGQTRATANGQAGAYQVAAQAGDAIAMFELENSGAIPLSEFPQPELSQLDLPELPRPEELLQNLLPIAPSLETPDGLGTAIAQIPLSFVNSAAIEAIDSSFSKAYTNYWGLRDSKGSTIAKTHELLENAAAAHGANSGVVYSLFVPQDKAADEGFGATQVASMALNRRAQSSEQRDDDQLMLVLVPNDGPPMQKIVHVTRKELLQQARLFRMAVSDPEDEWSYKPLAQQMYSWMLEPFESELERFKLDNMMYVLDSGLRTVPLAAMMRGDEFAIERYGFSLIPSVDLLETGFDDSAPSPRTVAGGATEFERLNDLPAVEVELDAIAAQAALDGSQRSPVNVLLNEAFTQENLIQAQQQSDVNILHLATHAEFNAGDLGSSYLQFWDDQLTLDDISQLGWDKLELLILSACQTAISSPEAELGFAGLAAASGVESTIGSLWSVSDLGTLGLMSEFYGQLGQTPLRFEALRQTQLAMLRGETRLEQQQLKTNRGEIALPSEWDLPASADFSHPFYWSGFTLVGNPWW